MTIQDGDDAASCPTRRRIELSVMPQVVLQDDDSRWGRCRKPSYQTTNRVGSNAASRPTRRRIDLAVMPQSNAIKAGMMPQERP
jgi:hypothetical protein